MEVTWLGHSCFKIRGREATLVADPFHTSIGYSWPRPAADMVTVSHGHAGHSFSLGVAGDPRVVNRPGEYEIKNVFIVGYASFHDSEQGKLRGTNITYLIEMEDVTFCHLGDLGHLPTDSKASQSKYRDSYALPNRGGIMA
ncbi:MAG: MBL fold metallo-hydrolase [Chloroflexi bacterium]|nr:MBL fold metallo-hydrolase [Chloroflexota bacterium]